jgi:hypothetical protein
MTTPTIQELVRLNENKLLAEIEDLKVTISESEVKYRLAESELVVKMAGEIAELKSQVEDLQEELSDTRTQSNMKDWQIRFLKEENKRLRGRYLREEND